MQSAVTTVVLFSEHMGRRLFPRNPLAKQLPVQCIFYVPVDGLKLRESAGSLIIQYYNPLFPYLWDLVEHAQIIGCKVGPQTIRASKLRVAPHYKTSQIYGK